MRRAREQELRLILDEERAERRLARARSRLDRAHRRLERAERRVEKRFRRVKEAEAELLKCQQRRALGPLAAPEAVALEELNEPDSAVSEVEPASDGT